MPLTQFDPPERFVAGAVGPPGQRTFFLQASEGTRLVTVSLEKEQVAVLGERLGELLDRVAGADASEQAAAAMLDNAPLDTPFDDDFRVQALTVAWDSERRRVVVEAHQYAADPEDEVTSLETPEDVGDVLRVILSPAQARAFSRRCAGAVEGGRRPCPFCGQPLDPEGHVCPRANGYRR